MVVAGELCCFSDNSGYFYSNNDPTSPKGPRKQTTELILGTMLLGKKSYDRLNGKAWRGLLQFGLIGK